MPIHDKGVNEDVIIDTGWDEGEDKIGKADTNEAEICMAGYKGASW